MCPSIPFSRETLIRLGNHLAPAAVTFSRLRLLLLDPSTELPEIVRLIRLDPALTVHVVRLSNSVLFGQRDPTDSLDVAVGRVGLRDIFRLVGLGALKQVCQRALPTYRLSADRLWQNSVATAAAAELLAGRAERDPGLAYSAGLLRLIGRVVLDAANTQGSVYPGEGEWPSVDEWERQTLGVTSAAVTTLLLDHWCFPAEVVESIRDHRAPLTSATSNVGACVLNLACAIVTRLGLDLPGERVDATLSAAKLTLAGVGLADLEECAERARGHFRLVCSRLA